MIPVQSGRGGWVISSSKIAKVVAMVSLGAMLAMGCSSKKTTGVNDGTSTSGIGDQGLGGTPTKGFDTGSLGSGEKGPLSDIHFDYNDYSVRAQDGEILKSNADWMGKNSVARVQIEGHCDNRGSEEYNIALGAKRAQAAKDYLETLGIGADRMSTISYGKELPVCNEDTDECWAQNRRDHFVVQQ